MRSFKYSKFAATLIVAIFAVSLSNCTVHRHSTARPAGKTVIKTTHKPLPPGHAKKIRGERSAKRFAPGHNK